MTFSLLQQHATYIRSDVFYILLSVLQLHGILKPVGKSMKTYVYDFQCFAGGDDVHLLQMQNSHKCIFCKIFPISDVASKNYTSEDVPNFALNLMFMGPCIILIVE